MTSLFQARRRAEEFAAAVDGAGRRRTSGDAEVSSLVELVAALRAQPPVAPRPEFARDLRERLMAEAETVLAGNASQLRLPVRERGRHERRLAVAASAFVLVGGSATMAAAAQSALPGDALYPIKRGIERAEAGLNTSAAGKGADILAQASDRLAEVEGLLAAGSVQSEPRIAETLSSFSESASTGSRLLFDAFGQNADPETIVTVRTFTTSGMATLEALAPDVPAEAHDELTEAALLLQEIDREASALCGSCAADLPVVEVPGIFLARAEVDEALSRAAETALVNDHPVVVPKGAVDATRKAPALAPVPSDEPETAPGETPSPAAPLPSSPSWEEPQEWPTLLPGLDGANTSSETTSPRDVVDGVAGAVETLLPDVDTDLTN